MHGSRDSFRRAQRDCGNRRSRAAQKRAERASFFCRSDDSVEMWDELLAERLVQMIGETAAEFLILTRSKRRCDGRGISAVLNGRRAPDTRGEQSPRSPGLYFKIGYPQYEVQARRYGKLVPLIGANDIETSKGGWCRVVGMPLLRRAKSKYLFTPEGPLRQFIQAVHNA